MDMEHGSYRVEERPQCVVRFICLTFHHAKFSFRSINFHANLKKLINSLTECGYQLDGVTRLLKQYFSTTKMVSNTYHVDSLVSCMQIDVLVYANQHTAEALSELKNQPIGANMRQYIGLHLSGKRIYYGPYSKFYNSFVGHRDVIIEIDKNDEEKVDTDSSQVEEEMDEDKKNKNMKDNKKPVEEKLKESTAKTKTLLTGKYLYTAVSNSYPRERIHQQFMTRMVLSGKKLLRLYLFLVNKNNINLTKVLIDYLEVSDEISKISLKSKYSIVEKELTDYSLETTKRKLTII
ncbi:hypothetical protein YC2023_090132 [Brassica napus]